MRCLSPSTINALIEEDLDGADADELELAGLTHREASIVLAALQPLLP